MSAFLKPDNIRTVKVGRETLTINEKIIPDGLRATKREAAHIPEGGLKKPNLLLNNGNGALGISTHNTPDIKVNSATTPAEQYVRATYNGNMLGVVVTFYVWRDVIWQTLRENERGWHASDGTSRRASNRPGVQIGGNLDTISIEAIGNDPQTVKTTQLLIAYLLREHNLNPETDVYTHLYFDRNSGCPAFILPRWESFMAGIKDYYNADKQPPLTSEDALMALRAAAGIVKLNKQQAARLDVDKDGKVTSADALMILRIAAGIIK
jgi:N-acetylmuramoyl-L-alanine amidase CwlA